MSRSKAALLSQVRAHAQESFGAWPSPQQGQQAASARACMSSRALPASLLLATAAAAREHFLQGKEEGLTDATAEVSTPELLALTLPAKHATGPCCSLGALHQGSSEARCCLACPCSTSSLRDAAWLALAPQAPCAASKRAWPAARHGATHATTTALPSSMGRPSDHLQNATLTSCCTLPFSQLSGTAKKPGPDGPACLGLGP